MSRVQGYRSLSSIWGTDSPVSMATPPLMIHITNTINQEIFIQDFFCNFHGLFFVPETNVQCIFKLIFFLTIT